MDDALGVIYTHGIAGLLGGLLVGVLADPNVIEYPAATKGGAAFSGAGWLWGHHPHQLLVQFLAALTIIIWDGVATAVIWMIIKYVFRIKLRFDDEELEIGDVAIHGEEAYPRRTCSRASSASRRRPRPRRRPRSRSGQRVGEGLALRCGRSESGPWSQAPETVAGDRGSSPCPDPGKGAQKHWLPLLLAPARVSRRCRPSPHGSPAWQQGRKDGAL